MIKPFLKCDVFPITVEFLTDSLKPTINRELYNQIRTHFQNAQMSRISKQTDLLPNKLKDLSMSDDEKEMLISMKDYILKVAKACARNLANDSPLPWIYNLPSKQGNNVLLF